MKKCLLLFALALHAFAAVNSDGDKQLWTHMGHKIEIDDKMFVNLTAEIRIGDEVNQPYLIYGQIQYGYRPLHWLVIAPGYRQDFIRIMLDTWRPVYSPLFDLILGDNVGKWEITDRSRVQYLMQHHDDNRALYRNRFRVGYNIKVRCGKLRPFIDDEVFFKQGKGLSENRFSFGFLLMPNQQMHSRLFYMLRNTKSGDTYNYQNVFGLHFYFKY